MDTRSSLFCDSQMLKLCHCNKAANIPVAVGDDDNGNDNNDNDVITIMLLKCVSSVAVPYVMLLLSKIIKTLYLFSKTLSLKVCGHGMS